MNLLVNLAIAGLLMATISYCWVLNRRIKILQDSKSELANLLRHFDEATDRASESIIALQSASKKISENIQVRIDKVNYLMEDLSFMIEKGNRLADKLDANFAVTRARSRITPEEPKMEETAEEAEETHIKPIPVLEKTKQKEKPSMSLEAVLEKVVGKVKSQQAKPTANKNSRSKAEQELLDMIRAGIQG